jgi:hypothetical protein
VSLPRKIAEPLLPTLAAGDAVPINQCFEAPEGNCGLQLLRPFCHPKPRVGAGGMVPPSSGLSITTLRIQGQVPDGNQDVVSTQLPILPDFREPPWVGAFILGVKCSDPTFSGESLGGASDPDFRTERLSW